VLDSPERQDHEILSAETGGRALKKPAREPWNERKGFMVWAYFNAAHFVRCAVSFYHWIEFRDGYSKSEVQENEFISLVFVMSE